MKKQIYYDAFLSGLVPVKDVRPYSGDWYTQDGSYFEATVTQSVKGYREGETVTGRRGSFVHKTGRVSSGGHILVRTAIN